MIQVLDKTLMAQLNLMISKFESLSQPQNFGSQQNIKGSKNDNNRNRLVFLHIG